MIVRATLAVAMIGLVGKAAYELVTQKVTHPLVVSLTPKRN